jgi:hypothetical protein
MALDTWTSLAAAIGARIERGVGAGLEIGVRTAALPGVLGLRWAGRALAPKRDDMPALEPSAALAVKVVLDELFFATEAASAAFAFGGAEWRRVRSEVDEAHALYRRRGWLEDPASYHRTPRAPQAVTERDARVAHWSFTELAYESGWVPSFGEPGRERWMSYAANRVAHARLLRHAGPPRPWVICIPGYRMGSAGVDFAGFRAKWLHRHLGLNVAIFVMPFHGPRTVGRRGGDGYLSGDFLDTIHAQAQAVWDLRKLVAWLRREGAPAIGVHGVSLGGYTAALLSALEPGLDRVVLGIPAACFLDLARQNVPPALLRAVEWMGFPIERIEDVLRVVSPLAMPTLVPREHRFLYAGVADRLAPPHHAWNLWKHWERPRIAWYQGSHVSFLMEPSVRALLEEALDARSMLESARKPASPVQRAAAPPRSRTIPIAPPALAAQ